MRTIILTGLLMLTSTLAWAEGDYFVGLGATSSSNDVCDTCDASGWLIEGGMKMDRFVTVEAKLAHSDLDDRDGDTARMAYFGANVSPDIGPEWLDVYGKAGVMWNEFRTMLLVAVSREGDPVYSSAHNSEVDLAYGLGIRANIGGWYGRLEALSSNYEGEDILNTTLSFGFSF